ncbi:MAG: 3-phosphoserine/phosphohydroxythreonine transaminase [Rhodothermales bacterium]|nr:3-phosphoserine/phosphohydroxythreonine transaminase [Rhodothermales bacterium]
MSHRLHNFSAGPGTLPESVLLEVRDELPEYKGIGSSIMEISHRAKEYAAIEASARASLRRLLGLGEDWHILFLQGGASMQFYQVPLNFLPAGGSADYLVTGTWASNAYKQGALVGASKQVASSKDRNFAYIPARSTWQLDPKAAYLHYTSNNTIFGTQFHEEPNVGVPLVCDASSDFLSRPLTLDRYGLIYAGAQKNIGPAGVTVVLVKDAFLQKRNPNLPVMLDYGTHAADLYNTPPVFAIYMVEKVLRWLEGLGGIPGIHKRNAEKAGKLYARIDATDFYRGTADQADRSEMNVCFRLRDEALEDEFVKSAEKEGLLGLKGHRSVGGMRASIYNACPVASVDALVAFMDRFERGRMG